jgi:hypothetical protein
MSSRRRQKDDRRGEHGQRVLARICDFLTRSGCTGCLLCGGPADLIGVYCPPDGDQHLYFATPGKTRLIPYRMCTGCYESPGCYERTEIALLARHVALGPSRCRFENLEDIIAQEKP